MITPKLLQLDQLLTPESPPVSRWAWLLSLLLIVPAYAPHSANAQEHSIARQWNEIQLDAVRLDVPRPTVHARNLFHVSTVMYDAWAVYDETARTYLLNNSYGSYACEFEGITMPADIDAARNETISYAAYRLLSHRFSISPNAETSLAEFDAFMADLGYDIMLTSTDYTTGGPAELGNYIAECMINAGLQDGSNEANNYANVGGYMPANEPLIVGLSGNPNITDVNRWQPLVREFTVENGEVVPGAAASFLSPDWGQVTPFAMTQDDLTIYQRDGSDYWVYHDPGAPPQMELGTGDGESAAYAWNFALVAIWSAQLDHDDGVMWDISPASRGNTSTEDWPTTAEEFEAFYDLTNGSITASQGHSVNPYTGQPYTPQMVPRGDYGRVLAEFWADGPTSETPPGHWYTILNEVNDHEALEKKFAGSGEELSDLEWDVKGYFLLGAAFHDVAISVWGIKSYYDFIRPVSAIRSMAARGQSSDDTLPSYSPDGIPLYPGYIELVLEGDSLAGEGNENVGKIKLKAWRGPDYIEDPLDSFAGVGWILADNWWPYQRPSFITPPFAGYVSGHSTFSRAASEILTMFTGDEYFPGGLGEFSFSQNEYLVFEDGPSQDITLQWATYRDASDETSLSRIWGGIHPPIDDIPGRRIGSAIAGQVFGAASQYFAGTVTSIEESPSADADFTVNVYPNPVGATRKFNLFMDSAPQDVEVQLFNVLGQEVLSRKLPGTHKNISLDASEYPSGVYIIRVKAGDRSMTRTVTML